MRHRKLVFIAIAVAAAFAAASAFAADVPQFTALYQLSSVSESTGNCRMTFTLRLFNLSGMDLDLERVRLTDPANTDVAWAEFSDVRVAARGSVDRTAYVTVPREEYDRWQAGGQPAIFLLFGNPMGDTNRVQIWASRIAQP